jgi:aspartate dehydrogenase
MGREKQTSKKVGIAGLGAMGSVVARALQKGIDGLTLHAASDLKPSPDFKIPFVDFTTLAKDCDLIIECLPAAAVPALAQEVFKYNKDIVIITTSALLVYPEILEQHRSSDSLIMIPSGAIAGLDGVRAMAQSGIKSATIASTKRPGGYQGAPYVLEKKIDLSRITAKTMLFEGSALDAARAFPANVNVAATLSYAGIGPEKTRAQIWADPAIENNTHEIRVEGTFSTLTAKIENKPDPANPKTSMLAADSIIALLERINAPLVIL